MTDLHTEDPVMLLAESVVTYIEDQRRHNAAVLAEMRALVEAVRSAPAPVVNVEAPAPVVIPPAEVRVEPPNVLPPAVQRVQIVGLPPLGTLTAIKRGNTTTITEEP